GRAVDRGRLDVQAGRVEAGEPVEELPVAGEGDAEGEQRREGAGVAVSYGGGEQLAVAVDGGGGGRGRDGPAGPAAGSRRTHSTSGAVRALPWACRARPRAMAASGSRSSRWRASVAWAALRSRPVTSVARAWSDSPSRAPCGCRAARPGCWSITPR